MISDIPLMHFRSVFISDVHLGYHGCRADLLLSFLRATRTENLYLVGDIVDLESLQGSFFWPQAHTDVVRTLLGKAKHGTRVVYVPGNHDEGFREYCGLRFGNVEIRRRCRHTTADGRRFLVTHGDEFDCHVTCSPWVAWLGSLAYRQLMKLHTLYNHWRARLGYGYWSLASFLKQRSTAAREYIERYKDTVTRTASQRGLDGVICGHIHRPDSDTCNGCIYLNDGDWVENCTALVEHSDGRLELLDWPAMLNELAMERVEPLPSAAA
ncbi:MAG: UDP-2,3-diacylglucosamine diphosphatase [Gammaproteobacteria bacterium]|nr:UDP-2,3-diacylglucosamine diphosphatase [Gammaproteobacteria bacterium]